MVSPIIGHEDDGDGPSEAAAVEALMRGYTRAAAEGARDAPKGGSRVGQKRWRIPPNGVELLECVYAQTPTPTGEVRDALVLQLSATPRQIQVWFQNKRQRALKRLQASGGSRLTESVPQTPSQAQAFSMPVMP